MGLPIARLIVEMHGGRIRIESDGARGTTMVFTLPAEPPAAAIAGA
ncbi:MAG: ATP-binding protein [Dehalococcoidia bacterium]|nr:ATP-binding protein [Dehalococcoidia bacterium]